MDENRNAAIKLFGKRIPLLKEAGVDEGKFQPRDLHMEENYIYNQLKDQDDKCELTACTSENHKTPLVEQEAASAKKSTPEEKHNEASDPMDKTPKKPDKILPCPRCKSMDTKFCYYNNYNVNQPRYLCKNCQRYWTAGGTMRNVPVGSGRRKNKSSCHYLQIAISKSAVQALQSDETLLLHPCSTPSSTLLSFGSNAAACTNPPEKVKKLNSPRNGLHRVAPPEHFAMNNGEDRRSEETARLALNEKGNQNSQERNPPFPSSNIGSTWPYPWNPALPFRAPSIPIPIYPAAYWSCTVPLTSHLAASSFANDCYPAAAATTSFPTEHLWREDSHKQNHEASILVPKTLRIDDPDEAAKSSIWTMISNKNNAVGGGHLHNAFQPKGDMKKRALEAPPLLHANPAALSRSLNFQETS